MSLAASRIALILSDMRSGSTLLDQLLGASPDAVSVGELHWLAACAMRDTSVYDPVHGLDCACGQAVAQCPFWKEVERYAGRPLESLDLRPSVAAGTTLGRLSGAILQTIIGRYPSAFRWQVVQKRFGAARVARDNMATFDAILGATGAKLLVDSSKSPLRYRVVYEAAPSRILAILLSRDYRAVVHSKMKRGHDLRSAALGWRTRMTQIEALTADIPDSAKCRIRFEDLCSDPSVELSRLCRFLDIRFSESMLMRGLDTLHHIGGSPSKLDRRHDVIQLDRSYLTAFGSKELDEMSHLVGDIAIRWEYGRKPDYS